MFAGPDKKACMSEQVKINNTSVIYNEEGTLSLVNFNVRLNDGSWQTKERIVFNHGNAVTVLLYNTQKNTLLLTQQFRLVPYLNDGRQEKLIETCAGIIEDETPEQAILREIKEETGYVITAVKEIMSAYSSPGAYTELLHYFIAEYSDEQKVAKGGGLQEEQEELDVLEVDFDEACRMVAEGLIIDAKTIVLIQYAQLHKLLK